MGYESRLPRSPIDYNIAKLWDTCAGIPVLSESLDDVFPESDHEDGERKIIEEEGQECQISQIDKGIEVEPQRAQGATQKADRGECLLVVHASVPGNNNATGNIEQNTRSYQLEVVHRAQKSPRRLAAGALKWGLMPCGRRRRPRRRPRGN